MTDKSISNIVFYKYNDGNTTKKQACIFYTSGLVKNVSFEEGIEMCEEICRANHISTKNAFQEMINKNVVHVMSGKEFKEKFNSFLPAKNRSRSEHSAIKNADSLFTSYNDTGKIPVLNAAAVGSATAPEGFHYEDEDEIEEEEKKGFFKRLGEKIKKHKVISSIILCGTALAIAFGVHSCANRKSLEGQMLRNNIGTTMTDDTNKAPKNDTTRTNNNNRDKTPSLKTNNNDDYDSYTYEQLLSVTNSEFQKNSMTNLRDSLVGFNEFFAGHYLENGKVIKASLKFDEIVALQTAYNDYSKDELRAYFNGADMSAEDLSRAYKDASLQLMGAYAMENSEHPVDMSQLIESEEGKAFYKRYHDAFLAIKAATGQDKVKKATEFYRMVREDFPISQKDRTEGISHAETYEQLKSYKLAVAPMIAAAEMMYQNLSTDVTLKDGEIDFLNDLGLCNRADKTFERIETITLAGIEDNTNPLYDQYKNAIIEVLVKRNSYYINDATRELTKLDAFQNAVNWHFREVAGNTVGTNGVTTGGYNGGTGTGTGNNGNGNGSGNGNGNGSGSTSGNGTTTTVTEEVVETHTETETTYHEEVTREEKPIPADVKAEIDKQFEEENRKAKEEAERAAEAERRRLQEEADREAARIEAEIAAENAATQAAIAEANSRLSSGETVNANDLGPNISIDSEYTDSQGNIDSSVGGITTDPSGDQTGEPLPDPNVTGAAFDAQAENGYNYGTEQTYGTYNYTPYEETGFQTLSATTETYNTSVEETATTFGDTSVETYGTTAEEATGVETTTEEGTNESEEGWVDSYEVEDGYSYEGSWIEFDDPTDEELVNQYVEGLVTAPEEPIDEASLGR